MSGFTDRMIDDGFTDPQEYMDYLESSVDDVWGLEPEPDCGFFGEYDDEEGNDDDNWDY